MTAAQTPAPDRPLAPLCHRCGRPIVGARVFGSAIVLGLGWVCGFDASPEEHQAWLQRVLANASAW